MPHPRHRRLKKNQIGAKVLQPAGLTNVGNGDVLTPDNIANLQNMALYAGNGLSPVFTAGQTGLLSDATSNADGAWTSAGLTGETTNAGALNNGVFTKVGITAATPHYYFPVIGSQTVLSGATSLTGAVMLYSIDGPLSNYVPYYQGGTATTASFKFGNAITGAGNLSPTHVAVYIGGQLAENDKIRILGASTQTVLNASGGFPSSITTNLAASASYTELGGASGGKKVFFIPTSSIATAGGMIVEFSSSAKTSLTPRDGVWIAISTGSFLPTS